MTTPTTPSNPFSPFLPTTVQVPEDPESMRYFLNDQFARESDVINDKKIGLYIQSFSTFNGNKYFYDSTKIIRNGYSALARILQYPNTGVLIIPNPIDGVNTELVVTKIWGSATRTCTAVGAGDGEYFSFFSQGDTRVSFVATDTTITITTTVDMTAFSGFIILEVLRNGT